MDGPTGGIPAAMPLIHNIQHYTTWGDPRADTRGRLDRGGRQGEQLWVQVQA
jgi:hypothetical protein